MRYLVILMLGLVGATTCWGQLPECDMIYLKSITVNTRGIYTYNPNVPVSTKNPYLNSCSPPSSNSGIGLAISPVLNSNNSTLTFYSKNYSSGTYMYYDVRLLKWIITGHLTGSTGSDNIAAGGGYIFSGDGAGRIYRYDGTGNAIYICTVTNNNKAVGIGDLLADCIGNFYAFSYDYTDTNKAFLKKYNFNHYRPMKIQLAHNGLLSH